MKSIYQDSEWLKLQESKEKGKAQVYTFEDENGKINYPFIKRIAGTIDNTVYYDLVTARGERGIEIEKNSGTIENLICNFDEDFKDYCKKNHIVAEFVRFSPWEDVSFKFEKIYNVKHYGDLYGIKLQEDYFNNQFSSSKRGDVRRAEKNNLQIEMDFDGDTIKQFIKLYNYTEDKYNVSEYYVLEEPFIQEYFRKLKDKVFIINAYYDNTLVSSCIILLGKNIAHYHFSANNPEYRFLQANTYLLYKSMEYAKEQGKLLFDLGGATPNTALEKYKMKFVEKDNECIFPYYVGTKVRNNKIYSELIELSGGPRKGYFPEYRK